MKADVIADQLSVVISSGSIVLSAQVVKMPRSSSVKMNLAVLALYSIVTTVVAAA